MEDKVVSYIEKRPQWKELLYSLRSLIQKTGLEETIKWGAPVYTLEGKNVVGLIGVKSYAGLWFYGGVFLSDLHELLSQSSETTKGMRKMMFESVEDYESKRHLIPGYLQEAIQNQKEGKEIRPERNKTVNIPDELQTVFGWDILFKEAFEKLTPGRRREYAEHIESAKQETTRFRRIEKIRPMVLEGKGLHDKYK